MEGGHSRSFSKNGAPDEGQFPAQSPPSEGGQDQDGHGINTFPPSPAQLTTTNSTYNPNHVIVTGTASLKSDDVEGGMVASKLRHVHVLSQPGCEAGKLHFSHNQVGEKTAMAIFEWENDDAFATWMGGSTSLQVWDQVVDFFKQNSIDIHRWKRLPDPRMVVSNVHPDSVEGESPRALRAKRLFDKALNVDAYVALLWFRAAEGQELMLINTLWEIELFTKMEPTGASIRFDIHTGYDPDVEGVIMVYLAFESEQHFQQHLTKDYNIISDRVCQYLDTSPLLTTWKTVDLSK